MKYDLVFIVLVYRNTTDLEDFFVSLRIPNAKVIVVNSYYDNKSEETFKRIASENNADFFSVPNKGYGTGNNRGVEYAMAHYSFKYLVISNADIEIQELNVKDLNDLQHGIYAPSIHTLSGKQQNPHMPYYISVFDDMKYYFYKKNNWHAIMFFCAINKVFRMCFSLCSKLGAREVYSAHGAFVIISSDICKQLFPFYDENVFLFTEEENLAQVARINGVKTYYVPEISIRHKEDGSTSTISEKQRDITRDSFIKFYNKWHNNTAKS